jgi:hypothetical protein
MPWPMNCHPGAYPTLFVPGSAWAYRTGWLVDSNWPLFRADQGNGL